MKNRFFTHALTRASSLLRKPGRMLQLVGQLAPKILSVQKKQDIVKELKASIFTVGRLITAYARGNYREIPATIFIKLLAAIIYFVNPIDLVPDFIVGLGLLDDLAVLTWVLRSAQTEIERFKSWEQNSTVTSVLIPQKNLRILKRDVTESTSKSI